MMKRLFLTFIFVFPIVVWGTPVTANFLGKVSYGQSFSNRTTPSNDFIKKVQNLSAQQLLDTAQSFSADTALIFYRLIINTPVNPTDLEQQKRIIEAYNKAMHIHYYYGDYRSAYEYLIQALLLCEKYNHESYIPKIYSNIGSIYMLFNEPDIAKYYYSRALALTEHDTAGIVLLLNNIACSEIENQNIDSAFYILNKASEISKRHDDIYLYSILSNYASLYVTSKQYDAAFYYFRLSLEGAQQSNNIDKEAEYLSELGKLFFEVNKIDSALFYIDWSNQIADKNNFLKTLSENYLTLSKIHRAKESKSKALDYYILHTNLKDSILNTEKFGEINQMQRLYEVSKTNQQIEQLILEQQVKEQTIVYQRMIQGIILAVLLLVTGILVFFYFQNKKLNTAYKTLFNKNLEIIGLQKETSEIHSEKYQKSALSDEKQSELLARIYTLMEDGAVVCDVELSVEKLADLLQSNRAYVSQVINDVLKKNFRTFVNEYRIREAQRLLSEQDVSKYTLDFIAFKTGFKSRNAFSAVFKEITGVTPSFYLKSLQRQ